MVRQKAAVKGKGKGIVSSSRQEIEEEHVEQREHDPMAEDSDDSAPLESRTGKREKRRKRRTPDEMAVDARLEWVQSIPTRGFKSERQVSKRSFGNDSNIITLLENQGLLFWTEVLEGYNENGVIEFYQKLDTSEALTKERIKSKVNGKTIVIDVGAIASYLHYDRPDGDLVNYPRAEPIGSDVLVNDLYLTLPNVGVPPHVPGRFTDDYRIVNQMVHYNLYPRGTENKPSKKSAELLYVFMNEAEVTTDWAKFILGQIVDFKGDTYGTARCPFPCMITAFLRQKGISRGVYEELEPPSPGVITKAELKKSKSQSKAAAASTMAGPSVPAPPEPSLWSAPDPKASKESIWRKLCCQNTAIWNCIQKEKKERKKLSREVGELKHELHWHTQYIESTSDEKYEAPPRVEEAASEEEVLFGPGAVPGGQ